MQTENPRENQRRDIVAFLPLGCVLSFRNCSIAKMRIVNFFRPNIFSRFSSPFWWEKCWHEWEIYIFMKRRIRAKNLSSKSLTIFNSFQEICNTFYIKREFVRLMREHSPFCQLLWTRCCSEGRVLHLEMRMSHFWWEFLQKVSTNVGIFFIDLWYLFSVFSWLLSFEVDGLFFL